jgi:hypothetical protein
LTRSARCARSLTQAAPPDARITHLLDWVGREMVPGLHTGGAVWAERRLLIFTEYEDTRRWVERLLREAVAHTERAEERIAIFSGATPEKPSETRSGKSREEIKLAFNAPPADHPLRILIATDAAREGLNLQRHCRDLFHLDLPWNPSRIRIFTQWRIDWTGLKPRFLACPRNAI